MDKSKVLEAFASPEFEQEMDDLNSLEDVQRFLASKGIECTSDEVTEILDMLEKEPELDEESLDEVSGGGYYRDNYNWGYSVGQKVRKWVKKWWRR